MAPAGGDVICTVRMLETVLANEAQPVLVIVPRAGFWESFLVSNRLTSPVYCCNRLLFYFPRGYSTGPIKPACRQYQRGTSSKSHFYHSAWKAWRDCLTSCI